MTATAPAARPPALPTFLLGWGIGVLLFLLVRAAGFTLLGGPCEGRTTLALLPPLLLGPGGLAFTASNWGRPRRAALGLGLVVASFLPSLAVGARDLGALRANGCAGGYVVIAPPAGGSVTEVGVRPGEALNLTARVGGYTPQTHPGAFALSARSSAPGITVTLPQGATPAGQAVPLRLAASRGTPPNTYTVEVRALQRREGRSYEATGTLTVSVRP